MVKHCCICKLQNGMMPDISFHSIPKDNELKKKWISNIGRDVSKTSTVCSQHFEKEDVYYKVVGESVKRFLCPTAVPCINLQPPFNSETVLNNINHFQLNDSIESVRVLSDVTNETIVNNSVTLSTATQANTEDCTNDVNICSSSSLENPDFASKCDIENMEHEVDSQSNNTRVIEKISLKRRSSESLQGGKHICNPRYVGDLCREDFSSDASWNIVTKYYEDSKRKEKTLNQKVKRLIERIENFKELLDHLKKLGLLSSEGYNILEISTSPTLSNIIKNVITKKQQYSSDLKEFASTLLFYSTSAYEYVRQNFMEVLPHPQTIRKWFSKLDFTPGISTLVLANLKKMIEEYSLEKTNLQFGLQVDEISIKRMIEWDGKRYYGQVDLGLGNDETEEATYALVFMLVCLNGHFKTPVAYYLIKGLPADARASIAKQILMCLHENGITNIRSITFDGASTNLSMVKQLGADFESSAYDVFFEHPVTKEPIVVVPHPCHMLKLARNTWAEYDLIDENGNLIEWRYLKRMVEILNKENLHPAVKIRQRHIDFQKEKMKVKLAAQIFSNSVADGLLFLKEIFPNDFANVDATATFCKTINDIFDFLNSRKKFGKYASQECVTKENLEKMKDKVEQFINYIKALKIFKKGNFVKPIPILESKRRMGFWGFITAMKSVLKLATYVFQYNVMSYVLTYKLSQDHLETFFLAIRRMGGFNNNPTCRQFISSYKKLVSHVNAIISSEANCMLQDNTKLLKSERRVIDVDGKLPNSKLLINVTFDHDYVGCNRWSWNEYNTQIVIYIAGFIVRTVKKKLTCEMCIEQLQKKEVSCKLIELKNRFNVANNSETENESVHSKKGLISPSDNVITICKTAEKVLRSTPNLIYVNNILEKLIIHAKKLLLSVNLFEKMDLFMDRSIFCNHKIELIDIILKHYYKVRLHHEAQSCQDTVKRIRHFHSKLILFKNQ